MQRLCSKNRIAPRSERDSSGTTERGGTHREGDGADSPTRATKKTAALFKSAAVFFVREAARPKQNKIEKIIFSLL